jgi:hypothetical protein
MVDSSHQRRLTVATEEFFKVASSLFLGIGIGTVLQLQLLPKDADASRRGHRRWLIANGVIGCFMFVLVATGELLCVAVLSADSNQEQLMSDASTPVKLLLGITAGYLLVGYVLHNALAVAWEPTAKGAVNRYDSVAQLIGGVLLGVALGVVVLFLVASSHEGLVAIEPAWPLWVVALTLAVVGAMTAIRVGRHAANAEDSQKAGQRANRRRDALKAERIVSWELVLAGVTTVALSGLWTDDLALWAGRGAWWVTGLGALIVVAGLVLVVFWASEHAPERRAAMCSLLHLNKRASVIHSAADAESGRRSWVYVTERVSEQVGVVAELPGDEEEVPGA